MNTARVQAFLQETARLRVQADDVHALNRRRYYELSAIEPEVVAFLHTVSTENRRAEKLRLNQRVEFDEWLLLCIYYGLRCIACGEQVSLGIDHVVPLSCGGIHHISNIQPMCRPCNCSKRTKATDYR